jgi:chromosome segregation ATPase
MRRLAWLLLLAACGDRKDPAAPVERPAEPAAAAEEAPASGAQAPAPPPPSPALAATRAELEAKERELAQRLAEREAALDALVKTHAEQVAALGDLSLARDRMLRAKRDLARLDADVAAYEARVARLGQAAQSDRYREMESLRRERDELERALREAQFERRRQNAAAGIGTLEEAPVAKHLRTIREVQRRWLEATYEARARPLGAAAKQTLNAAFRDWLREDPLRVQVVEAATAKKIDAYDFTSLDFLVRCQIEENIYDKQNIQVERKELAELRQRVEEMGARLDALDEKLRLMESEGGGEVAEYHEAVRKLAALRPQRDDLAKRFVELQAELEPEARLRERQRKEWAEAEAALEETKRELEATRRRLRQLRAAR